MLVWFAPAPAATKPQVTPFNTMFSPPNGFDVKVMKPEAYAAFCVMAIVSPGA